MVLVPAVKRAVLGGGVNITPRLSIAEVLQEKYAPQPGLGWKPGWWLQSRGQSHDGDRKPRLKPKPVASILKFRRLKPNPVASKIITWKPKLKPVASRP